jgi:hypothetical protein
VGALGVGTGGLVGGGVGAGAVGVGVGFGVGADVGEGVGGVGLGVGGAEPQAGSVQLVHLHHVRLLHTERV